MMKRVCIAAALLLGVSLLAAPSAQAQVCIDFDFFCDGLELTVAGGVITGTWVNTDCAGDASPVSGELNSGTARVECNAPDCPIGPEWSFLFKLSGPGSVFNLWGSDGGPALLFQNMSPYTMLMGVCPFGPNAEGYPGADKFREHKNSLPPSLGQ